MLRRPADVRSARPRYAAAPYTRRSSNRARNARPIAQPDPGEHEPRAVEQLDLTSGAANVERDDAERRGEVASPTERRRRRARRTAQRGRGGRFLAAAVEQLDDCRGGQHTARDKAGERRELQRHLRSELVERVRRRAPVAATIANDQERGDLRDVRQVVGDDEYDAGGRRDEARAAGAGVDASVTATSAPQPGDCDMAANPRSTAPPRPTATPRRPRSLDATARPPRGSHGCAARRSAKRLGKLVLQPRLPVERTQTRRASLATASDCRARESRARRRRSRRTACRMARRPSSACR